MQPWFVKALAGWLTKLCPFFSGQFSWESEHDECTDGETLDSRREERKGKLTAWLLLASSAAFVGAGPKESSASAAVGRPRPSRAGHGSGKLPA